MSDNVLHFCGQSLAVLLHKFDYCPAQRISKSADHAQLRFRDCLDGHIELLQLPILKGGDCRSIGEAISATTSYFFLISCPNPVQCKGIIIIFLWPALTVPSNATSFKRECDDYKAFAAASNVADVPP